MPIDNSPRNGNSNAQLRIAYDGSFEPVATIHIFLDRRFVLHVYADGVSLAPIELEKSRAERVTFFGKQLDAIQERLGELTRTAHQVGKLAEYTTERRRVGLMLAGLLFGYTDAWEPGFAEVDHRGNQLAVTLAHFYREAERRERHITITFAAESSSWNQLPFELALWRHEGREYHLGIAEHMAFVRKVYHDAFTPRCREEVKPPLVLRHFSSVPVLNPGEALAKRQHDDISVQFQHLGKRYHEELSEADVVFTAQRDAWWGKSNDIFQFYGHGTTSRSIEWVVERPGDQSALEIDYQALLRYFPGESLPRLFLFIACYSFGFVEALLQKSSSSRTVAGIGMTGAWRPLPDHNSQLVRTFYYRLFEHGKLDLAIQETRRTLESFEMMTSLSPDTVIPENWFQPVLVIRDVESSGRLFQSVARRHGRSAPPTVRCGDPGDVTRGIFQSFAAEQVSIDEILNKLERVDFPTSSEALDPGCEELHASLRWIELNDYNELEARRDKLLELLDKAAERGDAWTPQERERAWRALAQQWSGLRRSALVTALELGLSDESPRDGAPRDESPRDEPPRQLVRGIG